jgi:hypothetical protein
LAKVRPTAVIIGALVDNVATMFIMMLMMTALSSTGISEDEIISRMKGRSGLLLSLIIGLGCTGLGGHVSGRMAQRSEVLHGALVAGIGMVLALAWRDSDLPNWYDIIGFAGVLPAGMLGGHLAAQRRQSGGAATGKD